jgi:hypothetical protein
VNPDIYSAEHARAIYSLNAREKAAKVARSRAAQPKRKDTRSIRPRGAR